MNCNNSTDQIGKKLRGISPPPKNRVKKRVITPRDQILSAQNPMSSVMEFK